MFQRQSGSAWHSLRWLTIRSRVGRIAWAGLFGVTLSATMSSYTSALITSDTPGSHVVATGKRTFGLNLDGVGVLAYGSTWADLFPFCTASLITDRHAITAAHCFDRDYDGQIDPLAFAFDDPVIGFQYGDGAHVIRSFGISAIQLSPTWPEFPADLAVVTFDERLPDELPRYPLYGPLDEVGLRAVFVGYGKTGSGALGVDPLIPTTPPVKRAGLNRYDAVLGSARIILGYDFDSGLDENYVMAIDGFQSDLGFGVEAHFQAHFQTPNFFEFPDELSEFSDEFSRIFRHPTFLANLFELFWPVFSRMRSHRADYIRGDDFQTGGMCSGTFPAVGR
jgi:hypothetical protein